MRSGFGADQSILVLFADPRLFEDIDAGRFFRVIQRDSSELKPFDTFLEGQWPTLRPGARLTAIVPVPRR